jgi:hypothetical protein
MPVTIIDLEAQHCRWPISGRVSTCSTAPRRESMAGPTARIIAALPIGREKAPDDQPQNKINPVLPRPHRWKKISENSAKSVT